MSELISYALIAVGFAALPAAWGLRVWVAASLPALWALTLRPVTPGLESSAFDDLDVAIAIILLTLATLGTSAKLIWTLWRGPPLELFPSSLRWIDGLFAVPLGLLAGASATLLLAANLRGSQSSLALHLASAALAALAITLARRLPLRSRIVTVTALATLACLTLAGGMLYPRLILSQAAAQFRGTPHCLRTPTGSEPTTDQLRLLTLPQARFRRPNLVLTVMTSGEQWNFRWSYRSFAFRSYDTYDGGPCPAP